MSARGYVIYCKKEDVSFEEFKLRSSKLIKEYSEYNILEQCKEEFDRCTELGISDPGDDLTARSICCELIEYFSEKGIPLKCFDMGGWGDILILINESIDQYIKDPYKDIEKRFPEYMIQWAKEKIETRSKNGN